MAGVYLSKDRRGRTRAARDGESVWQGESNHMDVGGEETPIVHATERSLKATSVMIASAGP